MGGTRWHIEPKFPLTPEQKESIWAEEYEKAEGGFISVACDEVFSKKALSEIKKSVPKLDTNEEVKILLVGCGVEAKFENRLAILYPNAKILCGDFEKVVKQLKISQAPDNVEYKVLDTTNLGIEEEYDLVLNFDTIASESHVENTKMIQSCYEALKSNGVFLSTFSSVFAWADIAYLEDDPERKRLSLIDYERSSILKVPASGSHPEVWRIYYTPLRLRYLLNQVGFKIEKFELFFCDSDYFADASKELYGVADPDLPLYDHFVIARKS